MNNLNYLDSLRDRSCFTRNELRDVMNKYGMSLSEASFKLKLHEHLNSGLIIRAGRNAYYVPEKGIYNYHYEYSALAEAVVCKLQENHPLLDFTVFEMIQLNEFTNHQLAHNVVFLSVEGDLGGFAFDSLKEPYPGKVLINPTTDVFHKYLYDDMIVVRKLVTESPREQNRPWATVLEKLIVDIIADVLILDSVSGSEYANIYTGAFSKYTVNESRLFRYAKRRGAEKEILQLIRQKTDIQLRTR